MTPLPQPDIILVDDVRDQVLDLARNLRDQKLVVAVSEPENLTETQIEQGRVFLLDMFLTEWPGRESFDPGAQVMDGIALAGVIRARARDDKRPPPVIALNTGHPEVVAELPNEIREHALARAHGLEWVFLKGSSVSNIPTAVRVADLARAQQQLPLEWRDERAEEQLRVLLCATSEETTEVLECWPPIREVGRATAGVGVLRWLLHRILPYPCFLLDERHVAARLGITVASLHAAVAEDSDLAAALRGCSYTGALAAFDGPRWWRSRVERMLWDLSRASGLPAGPAALEVHAGIALDRSATSRGVVVLKADYTPHELAADVRDAVRIQLDDWPPYAEEAWALIKDAVDDDRLRERVLPLDRERLVS